MKLPVKMPVTLPVFDVAEEVESVGVAVGRSENPAASSADARKLRKPMVSDKKKEYGRSEMLTVRSLRMPLMMEGRRLRGKFWGIWLRSFVIIDKIGATSLIGIPLRRGPMADVAAEAKEVGFIVGVESGRLGMTEFVTVDENSVTEELAWKIV